jgi:hypothetical protein
MPFCQSRLLQSDSFPCEIFFLENNKDLLIPIITYLQVKSLLLADFDEGQLTDSVELDVPGGSAVHKLFNGAGVCLLHVCSFCVGVLHV